jgi:hypothetical protein
MCRISPAGAVAGRYGGSGITLAIAMRSVFDNIGTKISAARIVTCATTEKINDRRRTARSRARWLASPSTKQALRAALASKFRLTSTSGRVSGFAHTIHLQKILEFYVLGRYNRTVHTMCTRKSAEPASGVVTYLRSRRRTRRAVKYARSSIPWTPRCSRSSHGHCTPNTKRLWAAEPPSPIAPSARLAKPVNNTAKRFITFVNSISTIFLTLLYRTPVPTHHIPCGRGSFRRAMLWTGVMITKR